MNVDLIKLAMDRIVALGQEALSIHQELESWQKIPFTAMDRTKFGIKMNAVLQEQRSWADAVAKGLDEN